MATVTAGYNWVSGEVVTPAKMNSAATPTISNIANADVASNAAIAGTKIAPNFGSQNVATTGNLSVGKVTTSQHVGTENFGTVGINLVYDSNDARWEYVGNGHGYAFGQSANNLTLWHAPNNTSGGNTLATPATRVTVDTSGNVGIATATMNERLNVNGSIHLAEGAFKYFTTASEHLAFTKKAGPYHFYFRKTDDGTAGGANPTDMMVIKNSGQVRFVPLASDPAGGETGDVYYNSSTNKLRVYNGAWIDLH